MSKIIVFKIPILCYKNPIKPPFHSLSSDQFIEYNVSKINLYAFNILWPKLIRATRRELG